MIISDTLYHRGVDTILRRCLTHEEAEKVLNYCHVGTYGGHLSRYSTMQKILYTGEDTLSLHDALPICFGEYHPRGLLGLNLHRAGACYLRRDRKSTRLNSSHLTASRMPSSA